MFLNADAISNNLILMLPNFEVVWFVLPVLVLFATGIISFRIGAASISNRWADVVVFLLASQWQ